MPAPGDDLGEGRGGVGPDVETGPAVGQVALNDLDAAPRPVPSRGRAERAARLEGPRVGREHDAHARGQQRPAVLEVVGVEERAPHLHALGGQEGEGHAAADDERVDLGGEHLEHGELVGHLGAADDRHEGTCWPIEDLPQDLHLAGETQPGRAGQEGRRADDGRMGAVRRAEGLVDVGVVARNEALHEGRIVGLLPGSKRRFSVSPTPGDNTARRLRTGSISQRGPASRRGVRGAMPP